MGSLVVARKVALKPPKESEIVRSILDVLALMKVPAWRVNVGMVPVSRADGGTFRRSLNRGMSDIIGVMPGSGKMLAVEVKRPGKERTVTLEQAAFLDRVRDAGGIAIVATNAAYVRAVVEKARTVG